MGDTGLRTARGTDLAGDDVLVIGDGLDTVTGGADADSFAFKQMNPLTPRAAGTGPAFASITDFDAAEHTLAFDVAGPGRDSAAANFMDLSGGAGEQAGDMVLYFNTTVGVAGLLVVSPPDAAASIARFIDITSVEALAATGSGASDFLFM